MRQFHSGEHRFQRFGEHAMVVHADHGDVLADRESSACGAFVHIPGAGIVEAEESVRMLGVEQIADCGQCRPVVEHIDDQMIVIVEAGVPERRLIAFQTIVLRNQRLQATHIGDTCASGLNQSGGGVVADLELVRFHARDFAKRVGGIHQHQWRLGQRRRHMGDAIRHLGVQKAVGAVSLECGDFLALAVLAVGAHGDEHIAELACSGLRAQNHTAGVRGGGHLLTDETEDVRPACTQRTGQRIRLVAELGGDGAYIVRNFGLYAPLVASVDHQRYRRDGNPRLVRDFLHRNHASNDTP